MYVCSHPSAAYRKASELYDRVLGCDDGPVEANGASRLSSGQTQIRYIIRPVNVFPQTGYEVYVETLYTWRLHKLI